MTKTFLWLFLFSATYDAAHAAGILLPSYKDNSLVDGVADVWMVINDKSPDDKDCD